MHLLLLREKEVRHVTPLDLGPVSTVPGDSARASRVSGSKGFVFRLGPRARQASLAGAAAVRACLPRGSRDSPRRVALRAPTGRASRSLPRGVSAWACSALERRRPAFNDRDDSPFETAPGMLSAPAEIKCLAVGHRVTLQLELFVHALVSQTPPGRGFTRAWRQCSMRGRGALEVGWSRPGRPEHVTGRGI